LLDPSLNISVANFRLDGFIYVFGLNEDTFKHIASILVKFKQRLGSNGSILFECFEVEIQCILVAT